MNERASVPVPPPPPPLIAMPCVLESTLSYGQAAVTTVASATVTCQNLTFTLNPPGLSPYMIVECPVRRKGPRHPFVDFPGHVHRQITGAAGDRRGRIGRRPRLEAPVGVAQPRTDGFEHPGLHLDRGLRHDRPADGTLRREVDRYLEGTMGWILTYNFESADSSRRAR